MIKFEFEKKNATRIKVDLGDDVNDYAKSFLVIYNNVKNDKDLLKLYNDYGNNIYVVCETDVKDAAIEFLSQFGIVKAIEEVEIVLPLCIDYEYNDDIDTEFLAVEEI